MQEFEDLIWRPYMNCGPLPSFLISNASFLIVICIANDKKSAHEEEVAHRTSRPDMRTLFSGADFYSLGTQSHPGWSVTKRIFICTDKKYIETSLPSGRDLYFPARVWYSPSVSGMQRSGSYVFFWDPSIGASPSPTCNISKNQWNVKWLNIGFSGCSSC